MRPLVGFAQALALDASTKESYGLSDDMLMESAAIGMARFLEEDEAFRVALGSSAVPAVALCGGGNNGGDALAVARRLAFSGRTGIVAVVSPRLGPVARRRLDEARLAGVSALEPTDERAARAVAEAGLVLDGAIGVGFKGPARPELAEFARLATLARGPVIAIDVPSGLGPLRSRESDPAPPVRAAATLCVEPLKAEAFYQGNRRHCGRIVPISGVFHRSAGLGSGTVLLEPGDLGAFLPEPDPDCHKGERGALAVFAGSPGSAGAAALCARGGSAAGAGSVTLLTGEALVPILSATLVSQMVRPASDPGSRRFTAAVAGPGWGADEPNARALDGLWDAAMPLALDADALGLLASAGKAPRCSPLVLTPHPGEFAPLAAVAMGADPDDPEALGLAARRARFDTAAVLAEAAARFGAVVVLKGSVTWIGDPDGRLAVWDGRDPGLATAGSGDVLAGLAGGFLARGAGAWDAAVAATLVHGLAGRAAAYKGFYEAEGLLPEAARISRRDAHGNEG
ncbi:MAG: NAD(P)H-hydrate dehydratase [Spirochaetes bacterium]|nr:NAD(P)H-hydrate dehydratase [Spirochaetota bacterium]MBU1080736.1 NAD(P)H-hydrate dehydratase [Spirochaetota bacterium]